MATRCPYFTTSGQAGRAGSPGLGLPGPEQRCSASGRLERIGLAYQAETCLTAGYAACPRLAAAARARPPEREEPDAARPPAGGRTPATPEQAPAADRPVKPGRRLAEIGRLEPSSRARPVPSTTAAGLQLPARSPGSERAAPLASRAEGRRRPAGVAQRTETGRHPGDLSVMQVLTMAVAVTGVFTLLTLGVAIMYRFQVGPSMAGLPVASLPEGLGRPVAGATLRPTFTPWLTASPPAGTSTPLPAPAQETQAVEPQPTLPATALPAVRVPATSPPTRLVIAKIGLDIPVLPVGTKTISPGGRARTVWADVPNAGGFHNTSAYPGSPGNTVINGHRDVLGSVFRHVDQLETGDEIVLYVGEVAYPYQVVDIVVLPETFATAKQRAENLRWIGYLPEERLTLVTCTPVALATHRLLVIARPLDSPQLPEAGSTTEPTAAP